MIERSTSQRNISANPERFASRLGFAGYFLSIILIACSHESEFLIPGLSFTVLNALIFSIVLKTQILSHPFTLVCYTAFKFSFIFKAIGLVFLGYDTEYILATIRVILEPADLINGMKIVTLGHVALCVSLLSCHRVILTRASRLSQRSAFINAHTTAFLWITLAWIGLSSFIMLRNNVAVMGTEGVSLPYKLSGLLFYGRSILVPLILLYLLEQAVIYGRKNLYFWICVVFLIFVCSEMYVRASKGPLFNFCIYLAMLHLIMKSAGIKTGRILRVRTIVLLIALAVVLMPMVDIYRALIVEGVGLNYYTDEFERYLSNPIHASDNMILIAIERFFHRLVGFTQMLGILATNDFLYDWSTVLAYGSVAEFYTEYHLGLSTIGHTSGPSVLGFCLIIGGMHWWFVIFASYLVLMSVFWRATRLLPTFEVPLLCLIGREIFFSMTGGNIELAVQHVLLAFLAALVLTIFLRALGDHLQPFPG